MTKRRSKCDPVADKMGMLVKTWRLKEKLSQNQAAEYLEVNQSVVSKIESGKVLIGIDIWFRIASRTGIPVSAPMETHDTDVREKQVHRLKKIKNRA